MRGELVPDKTRWVGNPIGPWLDDDARSRTHEGARMRTGADPYVPGHGDLAYDVTHYDLELAYSLEGNRLDGTARLDCTIREDTDELALDLHGLDVTKVTRRRRRGEVPRPHRDARRVRLGDDDRGRRVRHRRRALPRPPDPGRRRATSGPPAGRSSPTG